MTLVRKLAARSLALILATAVSAQAHSLRVIASRPTPEPGRKTTIYFCWGHRLPVDELVDAHDITGYQLHLPNGSVRPLELSGRSLQANEVTFEEAGLYQAAAERRTTIYTIYTDAQGKTAFVRKPKNEAAIPEGGRLIRSTKSRQFAKALIVSGDAASARPVPLLGHAFEIVLESTPGKGGFAADQPVKAQVLLHGKPAAGVKVVAVHPALHPDAVSDIVAETDAEGRVLLDVDEPGTWIFEAYHSVEALGDDRTQFDSESFVATFAIPVTDAE